MPEWLNNIIAGIILGVGVFVFIHRYREKKEKSRRYLSVLKEWQEQLKKEKADKKDR